MPDPIRGLIRRLIRRLPLPFRVLFRQFLLRVIDLEALSIQADIPRFLGQFAALLLFFSMMSVFASLFVLIGPPRTPQQVQMLTWATEQQFLAQTMLVIGLTGVLIWDATFPDRRDVLVLLPLPMSTRTVLLARVAAAASVPALALVALNALSAVVWPFVLRGPAGLFLLCPPIWLALIAISLFVYGTILTVQGLTALLLPRRLCLRLNSALQIAAFGFFPAFFFLVPGLPTPEALAAPQYHALAAWSPVLWFFALLNQLGGSLDPRFAWLAWRAWIALALALVGAASTLLPSYLKTMRRTADSLDLQPGRKGWRLGAGNSLTAAILLFSLRSLVRSRQHRLALAVLLAPLAGIAFSLLRMGQQAGGVRPLGEDFMIAGLILMVLAVTGLRALFSLPISLTANWMLRATQVRPTVAYVAATRRVLVLLAVLPVCVIDGALGFPWHPWPEVACHLIFLALVGWLLVELNLLNFYKVPFTCSWMPGKVSLQTMFCASIFVLIVLSTLVATVEHSVLDSAPRFTAAILVLIALGLALWGFNRLQASGGAELYFEDVEVDRITTLGITLLPPGTRKIQPREPQAREEVGAA
jgi:hypothetical protein